MLQRLQEFVAEGVSDGREEACNAYRVFNDDQLQGGLGTTALREPGRVEEDLLDLASFDIVGGRAEELFEEGKAQGTNARERVARNHVRGSQGEGLVGSRCASGLRSDDLVEYRQRHGAQRLECAGVPSLNPPDKHVLDDRTSSLPYLVVVRRKRFHALQDSVPLLVGRCARIEFAEYIEGHLDGFDAYVPEVVQNVCRQFDHVLGRLPW